MQLLTSSTGPDWVDLDDAATDSHEVLSATLTQLLGAERLVVLTGLGTSMSVEDQSGTSRAPSMRDLWDRALSAVGDERWDAAQAAAFWLEDAEPDIELLLSRCQMALTLTGDPALGDFIHDCEREIVRACSFVQPEIELPHHEAFLRRVARRPPRLPRTQLFTTNYDLAFEEAAARTGFTLIDGFSRAGVPTFSGDSFDVDLAVRDRERAASALEWIPNVLHLLKLHGSIDWQAMGSRVVRAHGADSPLIIYPRSSKFEISYQQPFLELMARFQTALRRPDTALLLVGSGLADQHLVEPVLAAVRSNVRLSLLAASPDLVDSTRLHAQTFRDYIARGDQRLTLLAGKFDELVPVIPDLVPQSEVERHEQRMSGA